MELSISDVIQRLTCPEFASILPETGPAGVIPPHQQGQLLHAIVESYLRNEQLGAAFNLLGVLPADPVLRTDMMHRACNLISFANLYVEGATSVETEVPLDFTLALADRDVHLHGRCDCLVIRKGQIAVVDWKAGPRPDRLDQLQIMFYLYAALDGYDQERGEWLLYFYDRGGTRRGTATRGSLATTLRRAVERTLGSEVLRPGAHCTTCQHRRECTSSAYALG